MMVSERDAGDLQRLQDLADQERDALRRDRYRAVRLALEGKEALDIADRLDRSRRSVQDWVYAYRDGGIDAIQPKPQPGPQAQVAAGTGGRIEGAAQRRAASGRWRLHAAWQGRGPNPGARVWRQVQPRRRVRSAGAAETIPAWPRVRGTRRAIPVAHQRVQGAAPFLSRE